MKLYHYSPEVHDLREPNEMDTYPNYYLQGRTSQQVNDSTNIAGVLFLIASIVGTFYVTIVGIQLVVEVVVNSFF